MESMVYIGAAISALTMTVAAWGVTKIWTTIITTVGRYLWMKTLKKYLQTE